MSEVETGSESDIQERPAAASYREFTEIQNKVFVYLHALSANGILLISYDILQAMCFTHTLLIRIRNG